MISAVLLFISAGQIVYPVTILARAAGDPVFAVFWLAAFIAIAIGATISFSKRNGAHLLRTE